MSAEADVDERFRKYKAASDAAMAVATAKAYFFKEYWTQMQHEKKVKALNTKDKEMLRRHLKEAVAEMDDNLFFFAPDQLQSPVDLSRQMEAGFGSERIQKALTNELKRRLDSVSPTLVSTLGLEMEDEGSRR